MKVNSFCWWLITGFCVSVLIGVSGCSSAGGNERESKSDGDDFNSYWYSGKAELTRYELEQARYGELRKGDAVLVFVTEDFLTDKQVKHEFGDAANATSVLKLNATRKFYTGIYPYSVMTSVFTPVEIAKQPTLKVTSTSQEWCGQTFMQLNRRNGKIEAQLRSYFQAEGDQTLDLAAVWLEDELWTRLRIAPESLPTGEFEMIPGTMFSRFRHIKLEPHAATGRITDEGESQIYRLDYKDLERKLVIKFEKAFPYRILEWEETYPSGFGRSAQAMTTRAVKTHSIRTDYWTKNKQSDSHLRDELGLIY